jgi:hypothetical protein
MLKRPLTVNGFESSLSATAIASGTVKLNSTINNKSITVVLTDVLHIPSGRCNLISHGSLDEKGVGGSLEEGKITLKFRGNAIMEGTRLPDRLYKMNAVPISLTNSASLTTIPQIELSSFASAPPAKRDPMVMALNALNEEEKGGFYTA